MTPAASQPARVSLMNRQAQPAPVRASRMPGPLRRRKCHEIPSAAGKARQVTPMKGLSTPFQKFAHVSGNRLLTRAAPFRAATVRSCEKISSTISEHKCLRWLASRLSLSAPRRSENPADYQACHVVGVVKHDGGVIGIDWSENSVPGFRAVKAQLIPPEAEDISGSCLVASSSLLQSSANSFAAKLSPRATAGGVSDAKSRSEKMGWQAKAPAPQWSLA